MGLNPYIDLPCKEEKDILIRLAFSSQLGYEAKNEVVKEIESCVDYTHYQRLEMHLESLQPDINLIANPSSSDITRHLKKFIR